MIIFLNVVNIKMIIDPELDNELANFGHSDAPNWDIPREWVIEGKFDMDYDTTEFTSTPQGEY